MNWKTWVVIPTWLALTTMPALAEKPVSRGELLADSCFSCHGYDGKAVKDATIPPLADYPASILIQQMKAFRDGERDGTMMPRHAGGYSDEEIELMGQYIGKQEE